MTSTSRQRFRKSSAAGVRNLLRCQARWFSRRAPFRSALVRRRVPRRYRAAPTSAATARCPTLCSPPQPAHGCWRFPKEAAASDPVLQIRPPDRRGWRCLARAATDRIPSDPSAAPLFFRSADAPAQDQHQFVAGKYFFRQIRFFHAALNQCQIQLVVKQRTASDLPFSIITCTRMPG